MSRSSTILFSNLMVKQFQDKIKHITEAVKDRRYRYTIHGAKQRIARRLRRKEIEEAIKVGGVIEDYPEHHYGSACLILGRTEEGKALHILCSLQQVVDIITVYEPDPVEWEEDLKTRRKK